LYTDDDLLNLKLEYSNYGLISLFVLKEENSEIYFEYECLELKKIPFCYEILILPLNTRKKYRKDSVNKQNSIMRIPKLIKEFPVGFLIRSENSFPIKCKIMH